MKRLAKSHIYVKNTLEENAVSFVVAVMLLAMVMLRYLCFIKVLVIFYKVKPWWKYFLPIIGHISSTKLFV